MATSQGVDAIADLPQLALLSLDEGAHRARQLLLQRMGVASLERVHTAVALGHDGGLVLACELTRDSDPAGVRQAVEDSVLLRVAAEAPDLRLELGRELGRLSRVAA